MTRPTDAHKELKSFIVHQNSDGTFFVKESHFQPGYTPAHCDTEDKAILYQVQNRMKQAAIILREAELLSNLRDPELVRLENMKTLEYQLAQSKYANAYVTPEEAREIMKLGRSATYGVTSIDNE